MCTSRYKASGSDDITVVRVSALQVSLRDDSSLTCLDQRE